MNYRYLKINSDYAWGKHTITKQDLIDIHQGLYTSLIDCEEGVIFDAGNNKWKEIEGDPDV